MDNKDMVLLLAKGRGGGSSYAVEYVEQSLTAIQKAQARKNIEAVRQTDGVMYGNPSFKPDSSSNGIYIETGYDGSPAAPYLDLFGTADDEAVQIRGVANPTTDYNAANKQYVDGYAETVTGATPTITPVANTIYKCGELTSLTITAVPASGDFIVRFVSGSTATTTNFPADMKFPEAFSAEANTRYEINVSDGYALAVGWPTT